MIAVLCLAGAAVALFVPSTRHVALQEPLDTASLDLDESAPQA
jgi:hypothetical protein